MNARTKVFPAEHSPEHHSASIDIGLLSWCIVVPSLPKVSDLHKPGHLHDVKENVIEQTYFLPSLPCSLTHCRLLEWCTQGRYEYSDLPVAETPYAATYNALCVLTPLYHSQHEL